MTDHFPSSADIKTLLERADEVIGALLQWTSNWTVPFEGEDEWLGDKASAQEIRRDISKALSGDVAQPTLLSVIEAEARRIAGMYPQSSDGRNTFVIFADWISNLVAQPPAAPAAQNSQVSREQIERVLCCPNGCLRTDDCFVEGPARRWGRSKREREQADALMALLAAQPSAAPVETGALDPLSMLLDAALYAQSIKPEWAKAARRAVATARAVQRSSAAAPVEAKDLAIEVAQERIAELINERDAALAQVAALQSCSAGSAAERAKAIVEEAWRQTCAGPGEFDDYAVGLIAAALSSDGGVESRHAGANNSDRPRREDNTSAGVASGPSDHSLTLAQPQESCKWRPIETAPRESDAMFMVCAVGDARGPFVVRSDILWRAREAGTPSHLGLSYLTHWMPLPEMPQ